MQGAKLLLTIMILPFLFTLGHDIYISYLSNDEKVQEIKNLRIEPAKFMRSDVGWLWQTYSPISMEVVRDSIKKKTWDTKIEPILKQSAIMVTLIPFALSIIYLLLSYIIGIWPFYRHSNIKNKTGNQHSVYKNAQTNATKFNRKR